MRKRVLAVAVFAVVLGGVLPPDPAMAASSSGSFVYLVSGATCTVTSSGVRVSPGVIDVTGRLVCDRPIRLTRVSIGMRDNGGPVSLAMYGWSSEATPSTVTETSGTYRTAPNHVVTLLARGEVTSLIASDLWTPVTCAGIPLPFPYAICDVVGPTIVA